MPKKTPPADVDAEPTRLLFPSQHSRSVKRCKIEGIEDDKLTIAFEGQVTRVIREDFVTRKR
jgi:hypothetical protein